MAAVLALAFKDLRLLLRDRLGFFFTFGFPLIMAVFFGTIFSGGGGGMEGMNLLVIDEDRTPASEKFIADLGSGPEFAITRAADPQAAQERVRKGSVVAFVRIHPGFGAASERMFWGEPMRLTVGVDPSRRAEAGMIEGMLQAKAYGRMQQLFGDPAAGRKMARDALASTRADAAMPESVKRVLQPFLANLEQFMTDLPAAVDAGEPGSDGTGGGFQPVVIEKADVAGEKRNAYTVSFPQGIIWGLMGTAASFGISLVTERSRGTLMRLRMAPISPMSILLGKGLACLLTTLLIAAALLLIATLPPFNVRPDSPALLAAGVLSASLAFVGIMMLLSVVGKTEAAAGGIGWAVLLVLGMIGGAMVPQIAMPAWMVRLSAVSPVGWAIRAIEGPLWRGYSPAEMILPCAVLLGAGIAGFFAGARLFSFGERA